MSFNIPYLVSGLFDLSRSGTLCFPGLRKIRGLAPFFHQFGEFGEQGRLAGRRFWQLWCLECAFFHHLGQLGEQRR